MNIADFIGHFHPALVHLPIGILLVALFIEWLGNKKKYAYLTSVIPILLIAGIVTALISCITGYVLSISEKYDKILVTWHMWMGIGTTLCSLMLYAKIKNPKFMVNKIVLCFFLLILILITGYLGGSLTHGTDYYTKPLHGLK